jgi:hypothetical protein
MFQPSAQKNAGKNKDGISGTSEPNLKGGKEEVNKKKDKGRYSSIGL